MSKQGLNRDLNVLADEMRILKIADKARFIHDIRQYAILFDPQNPQNVPECTVDERGSFADILSKNLFYGLRGHYYYVPKYRSMLSEQEIKKQAGEDMLHARIQAGLQAYCYAFENERKKFERRVKMPKLFASYLRKKRRLDYDFR